MLLIHINENVYITNRNVDIKYYLCPRIIVIFRVCYLYANVKTFMRQRVYKLMLYNKCTKYHIYKIT